jgi:hypothetical protein
MEKNEYLVETIDVEAFKNKILKIIRNPKALTINPANVVSSEIHVEQLIKTSESLIN